MGGITIPILPVSMEFLSLQASHFPQLLCTLPVFFCCISCFSDHIPSALTPGRVTVAFSKKLTAGMETKKAKGVWTEHQWCLICPLRKSVYRNILTIVMFLGWHVLVVYCCVISRQKFTGLVSNYSFYYYSWFLWVRNSGSLRRVLLSCSCD